MVILTNRHEVRRVSLVAVLDLSRWCVAGTSLV